MGKHAPIPTIIKDFVEMQEMYQPVENSHRNFSSVQVWLNHIKNVGYNNALMEEIHALIIQSEKDEKSEESALLLLVSVATQNTFFNYVLAKELFKGKILEKNIPASFGLINILAKEGNHEAICDLALFYKHGIIVEKDHAMALQLYKQAAAAGVTRAKTHYDSLQKTHPSHWKCLFGQK